MKSQIFVISLFLFLVFIQGCTKEEADTSLVKPDPCDAGEVMSYSEEISDIIYLKCVWCHYAGSGIYDFSDYDVLADRIRSGRLEDRMLMPVDEPLHMPPDEPMDSCQLYKIRLWIRQGYKNN